MHQVAVGAAIQAAHQDEGRTGPDRVLDLDAVPVDARREVAGRIHHKTERVRIGLLGRQIRVSALDEVVLPRRAAELPTILKRGDARKRTLRGRGLGWCYGYPVLIEYCSARINTQGDQADTCARHQLDDSRQPY